MRKTTKKTNSNAKSKQRATITFRMNVLFFSIFILFSILIFRLGYLQIVKGEDFVRELSRMEEIKVNTSVPRGKIYDRYGRVLVDNQPEKAITYTKMQTTKTSEMLEIAEQLANLIEVEHDKNTERDILDFWILRNREAATAKVTQEEMQKFRDKNPEMDEKEFNAEYDKRIRERITEEELATLTDYDMEVLAIYSKMRTGYSLSQQIIKGENVTDEEFASVSERLTDLPGVNTTTDWKRVRKSSLAILGRTTVPSKGIPKSELDFYLAREYSRNDRVGESYLEKQYEEILQGEKSVVKNVTNKKGQVVETIPTFAGEAGKDVVSTIDIKLQEQVDKILEQKIKSIKAVGASPMLDRGFIVMMNPNTGEILSMAGKKIETDKETGKQYMIDYSYGSFTTSYEAGSTVKAATVLMGYNEGVIKPGTPMLDSPMRIGNVTLNSLFNKSGSVMLNDLTALERSSNVYMFKIAMGIGGYKYGSGRFNLADGTLQKLRNGYAQFGLGVPTGIDLPGETPGIQANPDTQVKLLNLAIGQFDTYTPLQLAQYISTVANGGYRIQPRIVKEVRKASPDGEYLGPLEEEIEPKVLNRISNSEAEINHVKEGLRRVYYGSNGSAANVFRTFTPTAAGKTGTAQTTYYNKESRYNNTKTINMVHVGFAPFDNPEVAYAIIFPWATTNFNHYYKQANEAAREILEAYFALKEEYSSTGLLNNQTNQKIIKDYSKELLNEDEESQMVQDQQTTAQ